MMDICPHALYLNLLSDLQDQNLDPKNFSSRLGIAPDASTRQYAAFGISRSFLKKLRVKNDSILDQRALDKFLHSNIRCGNWAYGPANSFEEELLGSFKKELDDFLHPYGLPIVDHHFDILKNGCHGSGSSIGSPGGDSYSKLFSSSMAHTDPNLYYWYKRYINSFPEWSNAELIREQHKGSANIVEGSRFSYVPKDVNISRCICIEPELNMFYQLGLAQILTKRLSSFFGINLETQAFKNRELARLGSIDQSLCTIDLECASDSISNLMLRWALPSSFYRWLQLLRSHRTLIKGSYEELNMVSSMGNGFTFPLQTVIFACVVTTAFKAHNIKFVRPDRNNLGNFGVFGDDIAVPREIYRTVLKLLSLLGFVVNTGKSFADGNFRESCGHDYHNGKNVRGVYLKQVDTQQDACSLINQLNLFSARTGIFLPKTCSFLFRKVKVMYVPRWENDDAGIKVPFSLLTRDHLIDKDTQSLVYRAWRPLGLKIRVGDSALFVPLSAKPRIFNPSGLHISFLMGSVSFGSIPIRHDRVRYRAQLGIAPNWDALPTTHPDDSGWINWQRWESAVYMNILF